MNEPAATLLRTAANWPRTPPERRAHPGPSAPS